LPKRTDLRLPLPAMNWIVRCPLESFERLAILLSFPTTFYDFQVEIFTKNVNCFERKTTFAVKKLAKRGLIDPRIGRNPVAGLVAFRNRLANLIANSFWSFCHQTNPIRYCALCLVASVMR